MISIETIKEELSLTKEARKEGLPIAGWRKMALKLFNTLYNENWLTENKMICGPEHTLTRRLAFDCKAELEQFFVNFGFNNEGEKSNWTQISEHLKKIYLS